MSSRALVTPNFSFARATYICTVLIERLSLPAMAVVLVPCPSIWNTSSSRSLSRSIGGRVVFAWLSRCIRRFPANRQVFFLLDQILKPVAYDRMIVHNKDAGPILLFHLSSYGQKSNTCNR